MPSNPWLRSPAGHVECSAKHLFCAVFGDGACRRSLPEHLTRLGAQPTHPPFPRTESTVV